MAAIVLGWIFVAATVLACSAFLLSGLWRRFPFFTLLLGFQAWQGASVNLAGPIDLAWSMEHWLPLERFRLIAAGLAALEVIIKVSAKLESTERNGLWLSLLFPVALVWFSNRYVLEAWPIDPLASFLRFREGFWVVLALSVSIFAVFLLFKPLGIGQQLHRHLWLLMILMGAHAFIAPLLRLTDVDWIKEQAAYRTIAAACCMTWATFIARRMPKLALPSAAQLPAKVDNVSLQNTNVRRLLR